MSDYSASVTDANCYICEDPSRPAHKVTCHCTDRYLHIKCLIIFKITNYIDDKLKCEICNSHYKGDFEKKIKKYEVKRNNRIIDILKK
jgi:hypothetical protein